ncbi:MAG: hypothetical protein JXR48_13815, partial [Candidatus Delongbacteria bacterium]|nr:hypothetical protein [Candidatus Delongbacteria bacterium]
MKKRNNAVRWIIFVVLIVMAIYSLNPSYKVFFSSEKNLIEKIRLKYDLRQINKKLEKGENLTKTESGLLENFGKDEEYQTISDEELAKLAEFDKYKEHSLALGLDLQGGMHLVLEIDYKEMLKTLAKKKDQQLDDILSEVDSRSGLNKDSYFTELQKVFEEKNIDLSTYYGKTGRDNEDIISGLDSTSKKGVEVTLEKLRNRINQFGISEP